MNKYFLIVAALVVSFASIAQAAPPEGEPAKCPLNAIRIDGRLDESAWQQAFHISNFVGYKKFEPAKTPTEVRVLYDDQNLYIAFKCTEPRMTELLSKSYHAERDGDIWNEDCVEIFISSHAFYHFIINSYNVNLDEKDNDASWNGLWESAVKTDHDYWQVEIKLPFHTIDMRSGDTEITLNFCREKYTMPSEISSWAYTAGQFINTQNYGRLKNIRRCLPDVAVKQIDWGSLLNGAHQIEMQLSNRSQTAWTGKAILEMKSADGKLLASFPSKPLRLELGQERPASIEYNEWQKEGSYIELITLAGQKSWPVLSKSVTLPPLISFLRMPVLLWQGEKGITLISLNAAQFTGYSVQATVKNAQGKIIQKMRQTPDNAVFTIALPTDALHPGEYHLELQLFHQGQLLKTQTCQFEVIPGF